MQCSAVNTSRQASPVLVKSSRFSSFFLPSRPAHTISYHLALLPPPLAPPTRLVACDMAATPTTSRLPSLHPTPTEHDLRFPRRPHQSLDSLQEVRRDRSKTMADARDRLAKSPPIPGFCDGLAGMTDSPDDLTQGRLLDLMQRYFSRTILSLPNQHRMENLMTRMSYERFKQQQIRDLDMYALSLPPILHLRFSHPSKKKKQSVQQHCRQRPQRHCPAAKVVRTRCFRLGTHEPGRPHRHRQSGPSRQPLREPVTRPGNPDQDQAQALHQPCPHQPTQQTPPDFPSSCRIRLPRPPPPQRQHRREPGAFPSFLSCRVPCGG